MQQCERAFRSYMEVSLGFVMGDEDNVIKRESALRYKGILNGVCEGGSGQLLGKSSDLRWVQKWAVNKASMLAVMWKFRYA